MRHFEVLLGDLIAALYEEFLALYGDPELASVATVVCANELLLRAGPTLDVEAA